MQIFYEQKHLDLKPPKLSQIKIHIQYHLVTVKTKPPQLATVLSHSDTEHQPNKKTSTNTNLNSENISFQSRQPSTSQNKTKADHKAPPKAQNAPPSQPTAKQQASRPNRPNISLKRSSRSQVQLNWKLLLIPKSEIPWNRLLCLPLKRHRQRRLINQPSISKIPPLNQKAAKEKMTSLSHRHPSSHWNSGSLNSILPVYSNLDDHNYDRGRSRSRDKEHQWYPWYQLLRACRHLATFDPGTPYTIQMWPPCQFH